MKKRFIIIVSFIFIIAIMAMVLVFMKTDKKSKYVEDEITFKEEYESLNGKELAEDYILKTIEIDSDNNIEYISDENILDKLTKGTNVIYFGWADCNWCRSLVPTLIETLKENEIDKLYYYNFKGLREAYENDSNKEKTKIYEEILDIIGEDITSEFATDSKRTGEKKILAPTVIFIKDGKYVGIHIKTVDSQEKSTNELTEEQLKEMKNILISNIDKLKANVCLEDEGC